MSRARNVYSLLNIFSLLAPLLSAITMAINSSQTNEQYGYYFFGGLATVIAILSLLASRFIANRAFYISLSIMMFTCSLMLVLFFLQQGNQILIVSIILLQALLVIPSLIYGVILQLAKSSSQ